MSNTAPQKPQSARKLKNFLVNRNIQVRLAVSVLALAGLLTAVLIGLILYQVNLRTNSFLERRNHATTLFTTMRGELSEAFEQQQSAAVEAVRERAQFGRKVLDSLRAKVGAAPETTEAIDEASAWIDDLEARTIAAKVAQAEELAKVRKRHDDAATASIREQDQLIFAARQRTKIILVSAVLVFSALLLAVLFFYTIVLSHRIAGPLYNIGRQMEQMRDNHLGPLHTIRKSDTVTEFFAVFAAMHDSMRTRTQAEVAVLEQAVSVCDASSDPRAAEVRAQLQQTLDAKKQSLA